MKLYDAVYPIEDTFRSYHSWAQTPSRASATTPGRYTSRSGATRPSDRDAFFRPGYAGASMPGTTWDRAEDAQTREGLPRSPLKVGVLDAALPAVPGLSSRSGSGCISFFAAARQAVRPTRREYK